MNTDFGATLHNLGNGVGRLRYDVGFVVILQNKFRRLKAVHLRHTDIHQHKVDIGVLFVQFDGLNSVPGMQNTYFGTEHQTLNQDKVKFLIFSNQDSLTRPIRNCELVVMRVVDNLRRLLLVLVRNVEDEARLVAVQILNPEFTAHHADNALRNDD